MKCENFFLSLSLSFSLSEIVILCTTLLLDFCNSYVTINFNVIFTQLTQRKNLLTEFINLQYIFRH